MKEIYSKIERITETCHIKLFLRKITIDKYMIC